MNKERLIEVLNIQSESYNQFRMFAYIIRQLNEIGCTYYVDNGNIYAIKGKCDSNHIPCIVAHMDTVHEIQSDFHILEFNDKLTAFNRRTMRQTGIGGDDKVGVYIALESLREHTNIKAAFFCDEEVGCIGSYAADYDFFNDCAFVLQCDRKGNKDFITHAGGVQLSGKAFKKAVKQIIYQYGYDFEHGMMTDVMALKECYIDAAMANIACGYYNPHSDYEHVCITDVAWCLNMVSDIITALHGRSFKCYYQPNVKSFGKSFGEKFKETYKPTSPFNADARNFTTEWHTPKENEKMKDWDYWENEFSKIKSKYDVIDDNHAHTSYCDSCREDMPTQYVPEFRMNICDTCLLSFENYNAIQSDSDRANFDS